MSVPSLASRASRLALPLVISLTLMTSVAACGRKGPVRPPLASYPAAPAELRVDQQGDDFIVSWAIPDRNQDGAPAEDLTGFRIYRMIYPAAEGCPTCRDPDELVATVELRRPEPAVRLGKRLYWRDQAPVPGDGHAYLVVPVGSGRHEGNGAAAHRVWAPPPPAPTGLRAETGEHGIRLHWTPAAELPAGQTLLGYNLYRRPIDRGFPPVPLNAAPLREPGLVDAIGEAGRAAAYRVTTVVRGGELQVESAPSAEAAATPGGAR